MPQLIFPIRMKHEYNGYTHAYDNVELSRLTGYGWEIEKPEEVQTKPIKVVEPVVEMTQVPSGIPKAKIGRPPKVK